MSVRRLLKQEGNARFDWGGRQGLSWEKRYCDDIGFYKGRIFRDLGERLKKWKTTVHIEQGWRSLRVGDGGIKNRRDGRFFDI